MGTRTIRSGSRPLLVFGIFLFCAFSSIHAYGETHTIAGVWENAQVRYADGDTMRVIDKPQPGLFIVRGNFYSTTFIMSEDPRPMEPDGVPREDMTHDQLKAMSVPFVSNAGTYKIENDQFVFDPIVALNQNFQESGSHRNELDLSSDGNTLVFIGRNGDGEEVWRQTWTRLE